MARLTGLTPETRYYYTFTDSAIANYITSFKTAPRSGAVPEDRNTHIWLLGDSDTATEQSGEQFSHAGEAGPVMMNFGGISRSSDPKSYDSDSKGPDPSGLPYLNIFSLPSKGELGGVPSGTEQYYAFNHSNVHIVSLDWQLSNRNKDQRAAMRE